MSCLAFFELLDRAILNQTETFSVQFNSPSATKTILFYELMTFNGQLNKGLFHFVSWLIESNDREIYLCKHCNIKFHHFKNDIELLKVTLCAKSRCRLHFDKGCEEWAEKCWIQWNNRFMKLRAASSQSTIEKSKNTDPAVDKGDINVIQNAPASTVQLSRNTRRQSLSIFFNGQSPPAKKGLDTPPLSPKSSWKEREELDDTSTASKGRFSFSGLRQTLSGNKLLSTSQQQQLSDQSNNNSIDIIGTPSISAPMTPETVADNMDQSTVQSKVTTDTLDSVKSSSGDADNLTNHIASAAAHPIASSGARDLLEEFNSSNCGYIIDCAKTNSSSSGNYENATISRQLGIDIHGDGDGDEDEDDTKRKITDPEIQALLFGNNLIMEPHPKAVSAPSSPSSSSSSAVSSSTSTSTSTATTLGDIPLVSSKPHSREKYPCNSSTAAQDGGDCLDHKDDDYQAHGLTGRDPRMVHVSSLLSEDAKYLAELFMIKSPCVFDGEYLGKRASTDIIFKHRFFWICPSSRSIHWMKSQEHKWDPSHSKYILLRQCKVATTSAATTGGSSCSSSSSSSSMVGSSNAIKKARGHCIGILVRAEFGPNSLRIHTHSGLYIELKLPTETMACWRKTILSLV